MASVSNPLSQTDHAYRILDEDMIPDGKGHLKDIPGSAAFGENVVNINRNILENVEAQSGSYKGTGLTEKGDPTLARTASHETGHSANLDHVEPITASPGNLLHQSNNPNAGKIITKEQINEIKKSYKTPNGMNRGKQIMFGF